MEIIEKMDGKSMDVVARNIEKMKALFPEVFTEGKIDFEILKEVLGNFVDNREERYSFTWNGKSQSRMIAQTQSCATLRPCSEESVDWEHSNNIFIEGDNLESLKLLQKSYHRRLKMIYIDPPYNTGKEFIYPDRYQDNINTYLRYTGQVDAEGFKFSPNTETSGRFHTNWLNMIYPRLKLARNLLSDDGSIWISIDDNEAANLIEVCKEIFGEENFVATFIWQKRTTRENRKVFSFNHDFIVCFARNKQAFELSRGFLPFTEEVRSRYGNPDNDKRGDWQSVSLNAQAGPGRRKEQFYSITTPGGRIVDPPAGRCWIVTEDRMRELIDDGRVWFGEDGNNVPRLKNFLSEAKDGLTPHTLWLAGEVGTTDSAKRELTQLFGGVSVFDTPKPVGLLERIVQIAMSPGDIAMDFFAGSAPLAEAIIKSNSLDNEKRRYILVQLPEKIDESLPQCDQIKAIGLLNIADIGKERIRKCTAKIKEEHPDCKSDLGFKVFKLDSSNIKPWDVDFDLNADVLESYISNIKKDRTEADVLYEILIKYGLDLTLPIGEHTIAGEKVFDIGMGALTVCLSKNITLDVVEGIARLKDELNPEVMRVVFRDSGFKNDVVKTNAVQILKQAGINDIRSL